jgi:hypothetical protein
MNEMPSDKAKDLVAPGVEKDSSVGEAFRKYLRGPAGDKPQATSKRIRTEV